MKKKKKKVKAAVRERENFEAEVIYSNLLGDVAYILNCWRHTIAGRIPNSQIDYSWSVERPKGFWALVFLLILKNTELEIGAG